MKKLIIASNNEHKITEIKNVLSNIDVEVKSLKDENILIDIEEDGKTFEENSNKKASEIYRYLINQGKNNFIVMADDSGLEVDYLNGEPGIYSARYAGAHGDDKKNNEKLLKELEGVPKEKRKAKFICQISIIDCSGKYESIRGEVSGIILNELSGNDGFGYDPLFYYEPLKKTFAELSMDEKNTVSHRGIALKKLKNVIEKYM